VRAKKVFDGLLVELDEIRDQQGLARHAVARKRSFQPLIDDALVGGVLIDHDEAVAGLRHDIGLVNWHARGAERTVEQVGRDDLGVAQIGRWRVGVERCWRGFSDRRRIGKRRCAGQRRV
jgi:hypothetical protein